MGSTENAAPFPQSPRHLFDSSTSTRAGLLRVTCAVLRISSNPPRMPSLRIRKSPELHAAILVPMQPTHPQSRANARCGRAPLKQRSFATHPFLGAGEKRSHAATTHKTTDAGKHQHTPSKPASSTETSRRHVNEPTVVSLTSRTS